ncbi:gliding motility-associated C-terminal domain-containing protein [Pedobacter sp. FW305-3-2-15-E-R2A2]|uniref:T9SS type B sorting domain-containing protein n=1 Tax=Pedobacter sp. FW305-3-2-15-E-R2A2 TaxID=3140251 RepID=UPI0031401FBB
MFSFSANVSAQVQATGGTGLYKNNIYWLNFTGLDLAAGQTKTFTFTVNGTVVTAIIDNVVFSSGGAGARLRPYRSGSWQGDRLDRLYNIGGTSTNNTLVNAITTIPDGADATFRIRTYATTGSSPADIGLVFGNAEDDSSVEFTQGTTDGNNWKLLERIVTNNNSPRSIIFSNLDKTVRLNCSENAALLYTDKPVTSLLSPLTINCSIQAGGLTAMALGLMTYTEKSDGPLTYGSPVHTLTPTITGGSNPTPGVNNTVSIANPEQIVPGAVTKPPTPKLGAIAGDFDPASFTALGTNADADNLNGENDEDGIASFPRLRVNATTYSLNVAVGNTTGLPVNLVGWIDFNRNGTFEAAEGVQVSVPNGATTATLTWTGLSGLVAGQTYARFRISNTIASVLNTATPESVISNGEVEDYTLQILPLDFGDAPNSYGTRLIDNGPRHALDSRLRIGATTDGEPDGQPVAAGADANGTNGDGLDEDAFTTLPVLTAASTSYSMTVPVSNTTGVAARMLAWVDFNKNGTFEASEGLLVSVPNNATSVVLNWTGLANLSAGLTYARLRLTTDPVSTATTGGAMTDGEVEDYSVMIDRSYDLGLLKTSNPTTVNAGQGLTYTITLTNNGPSPMLAADVIKVVDNLPAGFTATSYTPAQGTYTSGNGDWTGLTLSAGQSTTLTITGTVAGNVTSALTNTVTVTNPPGITDFVPGNNTASVVTNVNRVIDFEVTKISTPNPVTAGVALTYTVTLKNNGPGSLLTSDIVKVVDVLPAGFTATGYTVANGTYTSVNGNWTGLTLANGQSTTLTITGTVDAAMTSSLTNTATVTAPVGITDPVPGNNTATDVNTTQVKPVLLITKLGAANVTAGNIATYTLTITNTGSSNAVNADITDAVPAALTNVSWSTAVAGAALVTTGATGTGNAVNLKANIPAGTGNTVTVTISGTVNPGATGTVSNTGTATPAEPNGTGSNSTVNSNVTSTSGVVITKTGPSNAVAGNVISYQIEVGNNGPSNATGIVISDPVPAALTNVSWTTQIAGISTVTAGATGSTSNVNVTANIAAGAANKVIVTVTGTVNPAFTGNITNVAIATPKESGSTPVSSQVVTAVQKQPVFTVAKTGPATAIAGDNIGYIITVKNAGPSNSLNTIITDVVPSTISNISWTSAVTTGTALINSGGSGTGNAISLNADFNANSTIQITVAGTINSNATGTITNSATATPAEPGVTPITSTPVNTVLSAKSGLTISKTAPATANSGAAISYTITVGNTGPSNAIAASINDIIPTEIQGVTWSSSITGAATITSGASGTGNNLQAVANIPAGTGNKIVFTVNGTVSAAFNGNSANTSSVTATEPDSPSPTSTATTAVSRIPELLATKNGPSNIIAGDAISYKIIISNTGIGDAIGTTIKDAVPAKITNVNWVVSKTGTASFAGNASNTGNNISFTGNIPAGAGNTIVIDVTGTVLPSATGNFSNMALAIPIEPVPTVNSNTVVTTISNQSGLVMLKNGPSTAQAGTAISYTLKISNTGLSDAMNALITDAVPAQIKGVSWSAAVQGAATLIGTGSGTGNAVSLNGNIPTGAANAILVTINGTVDPSFSGSISNTGTADPSEIGSPSSSSTVTTQVGRTPVLTITKTGPATLNAGQNISYTIEVTNTSVADAQALVITDAVPAEIGNVNWSASTAGAAGLIGTGTGTGNAISITGNLPTGAANKITITVTGTVAASFNGSLANTATAEPAEPGTTPKSATATTAVSRKPILSIVKAGPATITAGQQITYTVTVSNTGTSNAVAVAIADLIPASIKTVTWTSAVSGTALVNTGATGSNNNLAVSADIPAGSANKVTLTIRGTVDPAFSGSIVNTATATPSEAGTTAVTSTTTATASRTPDVSISKTGPATLISGQNISYTITINNFSSSDAKALVIADQVPATITGVNWSAAVSGGAVINGTSNGVGNAISITGDLPAGTGNVITITVNGTVSPAFNGTITNTASATPAEPGTVAKTATSTTTISKIPLLSIQKTGPATISAGQQINYTLTINNTGTANADNATITDVVPAGVSNVSWTAVAEDGAAIVGTASGTGNNISVNANIPAGVTNVVKVNIQGTVNASATGTLSNTGTVTPAEAGTTPNSSNVTTTLQSTPGITLSKSGPSQIAAGQTVTYTVIAGNSGPSDATNLSISDLVPAPLTNVSWSTAVEGTASVTSGASGTNNNSVAVNGNIAAGAGNRILITISGQVPSSTGSTSFANTATATPSEPGVPPVNSNTITTTINKKITISAVKSATAALFAGENITYTLEVKNSGPSDALNLLVADQLPAGIINVNWTTSASGTASLISGGIGSGSALSLSANIPAGAANGILVTVTGKVDPSFAGTQLVNVFNVTPSEPGNPPVTSNTTTTLISRKADLQIQKTGPSTVVAGRAINYTITVNNAGPSNTDNVNIADAVPAGITGVTWMATAQNGAAINGSASGSGNSIAVLAAIPSGAGSVTINVSGTIAANFAGTSLINTATATPEPGITDLTPATSTVTTAVGRVANVRIIKSGPANVIAGDGITYNIRIVNDGPSDGPGVVVSDALNALVTNATWTATGLNGATVSATNGSGNVNFTAGIPAGTGEVEVVITGTINPAATPTTFTNTATADFPPGSLVTDPDLSSNTSTVPTEVVLQTDLLVSKSGPATIDIGDRIDYSIEIKNGGISNITNASITDIVPNSVEVTNWTITPSNGATIAGSPNMLTGTGNSIVTTGDIPATAPGMMPALILIRITGTVKTTAAASFTNEVVVTANGEERSAVTTSVNQSTDVYVEKSGPQSVIAGSTINYQLKIGNDGPVNITGLTIADNIPADIKNVIWTSTLFGTATLTGATQGNTNSISTTANITAGAANYILINVQGTVDAATAGKNMTNTAAITLPPGKSDFNNANNTSSVVTAITSKSGLSVRKMGPSDAVSGAEITYTVLVSNAGPSNVVQTAITDVVPSNIKNVSWTSAQTGSANITAGATGTNNNNVSLVADIPAGAGNEVSITIKGTIDPGFAGQLVNNAVATPVEPGNPPVTSENVTTNVSNKSGLSIVKSGPSLVDAGGTVQYSIEVSNAGPGNAVAAVITDQVPAGLTNVRWTTATTTGAIVTAGATGTNNNAVSVTANLLAGAGKLTITIIGDVPANSAVGNLLNSAIVTPAEPGNPPVSANEVTTAIVKNVSLSLTKSGPATLNAGEAITYTIAIKNAGPSNATAARLTDVAPENIKVVSWTSTVTGGTVIGSGGTGTGNNLDLTADIPVNGTILVNIKGTVDPLFAGTLTNTATLTPTEAGETPINAVAATTVKKLTKLLISKSGAANAIAGQVMTYQIKVSNEGPSTALGALITDAIPAQLEEVSWTTNVTGGSVVTDGITGTGNALSVKANIPVGQQHEITITVTGKVSASYAGTISNIATVTPADPDNPPVVTPPVETVVVQRPVIVISKTGPATATAGGAITYTIEANNTGLSDATNLVITDAVPADIRNVSWTAVVSGNSTINGLNQGSGNSISLNGNIPTGVNHKITITVNGTIDPSFAGTLSNTATATPAEPGNPPVVTPPVTTVVTQSPVIVVNKTGPATATAGGAISYVIEVSNTGLSNAKNLAISDVLDPAITGATWTASIAGSSTINGAATGSGNVVLNGNIPAGTGNKISITVNGILNPDFAGKITNVVTGTPSEPGNPPVVSPPVETNVEKNPVIVVTKTGQATATAGGEVTYTIVVVNNGLSNASGTSVVDDVPAELINVNWTAVQTGAATVIAGASGTGNQVRVTGDLPAGNSNNKITITVKGTVSPAFSGKINNVATASVPGINVPNVVTPPVETEVGSKPGIVLRKDGPSAAISGSQITYTITAGNTGLSNAQNLLITDDVPASLSDVSWTSNVTGTAVVNNGGSGTGNLIQLMGNLPAGIANTIVITVKGTIDPSFNGNLTNKATASPSEPGIVPVDATSTAVVSKTPVLAIAKNGPAAISAGQDITYTINVSNTGTANADNASIIDQIPLNITGVTWTTTINGAASVLSGAVGNGNNLSVNVNVPAGAANTILITVKGKVNPSATTDLVNKATVTPSEQGTVPASSTVTTTIKSEPSVSLVKNGPSQISAGQTVTYTLIAGNNGPSDTRDLVITDPVPAGLTNVSWSATTEGAATLISGATGSGNAVSVKGDINAGAANRILITITGKVPGSAAAGVLTNTATATPSEPGIPAVPSNTITTTIDHKLNIRAVKSAPTFIAAGEGISYTLEVFNDGPADAANLAINDVIPSGILNVSWTTSTAGTAGIVANGSGSGTTVNPRVNIPAGAANSVTVLIKGDVDPGYTGATLKNSFTATPSEPGNPAVPSEEVITNVVKTADLQIQKTGPSTVVAGSAVSYTINVKNAGPSHAGTVNIVDVIPTGLTGISWTATAQNGAAIIGANTGTGNINLNASIPAGNATVQILVTGTVAANYTGTSLVNTATATPGAGITDPTPATSTVTTAITRVANVRITKSGPADVAVGEMMTYNLRIVNDGPSDAIGVLIKDVIPGNLEAGATWTATLTGTGTSLSAINGTGDLDLVGNIPSGTGVISINISAKVKASNPDKAIFTNTATAFFSPGSSVTDPELSSNTSTVPTIINNDPVLRVSKSGPSAVNIGDPINYRIVIRNGGAGNITNADISDPVPADVAVSSWTATNTGSATIIGTATGTGNNINFKADIPADNNPLTAITIDIQGTIKATAGAIFTNTVTVTANGERKSSVVTAVNQSTDLKIEKTGPQALTSGSSIAYTIKVSNQGPIDVAGLTINDNVPAEIGQINWTAQAFGTASLVGAPGGSSNAVMAVANVPVGAANYVLINVNGVVNANTPSGSISNVATVSVPNGIADFNPTNNTSTVNTQISSVSGLSISKSGPPSGVSGSAITYTIRVKNSGPSNASQAQIKDVVPAGVTAVSWIATSAGTAVINSGATGTGSTVIVSANIPAGAANEINVTINGTIDPGFSGQLLNNATVTPSEPGNPPVTSGDVTTTVSNKSNVRIVKSGPTSIEAGKMVNYTLALSNAGPGNAMNVDVSDAVPAVLRGVSWTATANSGAVIRSGATGGGNAVALKVDLPAGNGTVTVNITGLVPANAANGSFSNTATATPVEPGNPAVPSNIVTTAIVNNANLSLVKSGPAALNSGEAISYTLRISNSGPSDAIGLKINDVVPAQVTGVSWTSTLEGGATISSGANGTVNNVDITANVPANGNILVTIIGRVNPTFAGVILNKATITPADPAKPVIGSEVSTTVKNLSSLKISKTGPARVTAGQVMKYQIKVNNNGPGTAQNAVISDVVPAQLKGVSWIATATGNATISNGQTGTGNILSVTATVPSGTNDVITIDITGTVDASFAGKLSNTATVTPLEPGNPPVVTPPVETVSTLRPGVTITKTGPATITAGAPITYVITAGNTGLSNAKDLMITDNVPSQIKNVQWITSISGTAGVTTGATGSGNAVAVKGDIAAGAANKITITITGTVDPAFSGKLSNFATGTPAEPGNPPVVTPPVETTTDQKPGITITKTGPATITAGAPITYVITAGNTGLSNAKDLVITDNVPSQIKNVQWTTSISGTAGVTTGATGSGNAVAVKGDIAAGAANKITITITGTVDPAFSGKLSNFATGTPAEPGNPPVVTPPVETTTDQKPGITITKTGPATITAGAPITYVITAGNTGLSNAKDLVITDNVPAQIKNVQWTTSISGTAGVTTGATGSGNAVAVKGDIAGGAANKITITITGTVDPAFSGKLSNFATGTPAEPGNPPVVTPPVETTTDQKPGITISKTGPATIGAGANITYVITAGNTGLSNAKDLVITDNVPSQIKNVQWTTSITGTAAVTAGATGSGNSVVVKGDIAAGAANKVIITVTGTVDPAYAGPLSNTATGTPAEPGVPPVVTPPVETEVSKIAALTITKTGPVQLKSGDLITYVVEVSNTSLSNADNATIADLISSDIQNVKWTTEALGTAKILSGGTGSSSNVNVGADLPAGAGNKVILTITGNISKSFTGKIENTARALSNGGTTEVSSNLVSTTVDNADFIIPNVITPNGDGSNDTFKIKGLENYPGTQVTIFNRWGNEVYRSGNYTNDWDGSQLNEGTYYYLILRKEKTGSTTTFKGWMFIKR